MLGIIMETGAAYTSYIVDVQNLKTTQGRINAQKPYAQAFDDIYSMALDSDVTLDNAKKFIDDLSTSQLNTLQKYKGLADAINTNAISAEGAYNLMMHDNEQYDFNADGLTEVGIGKSLAAVPATMPSDVRVAYVDALNSLEWKDRLMAMTLTFDMGQISSRINNMPYVPATIDYNYLSTRVDGMLNPTGGGFTSQKTRESIATFWEAFEKSYATKKTDSTQEEKDPAVEKFLDDLRTKGAVGFLADLNKEKIETLVKEFRDKLVKEMGDSPTSIIAIDKLVNAFKKQLLEEMQGNLENGEKTLKTDSQAFVKILLDIKDKEEKPLEKLLRDTF